MKVEDFEKIKKKIEEAKAKRSRAEGALDEAMVRLKKELGCGDLEEAQKELAKLQKEIDKDEEDLDALIGEIEKAVEWDKL